MSISEVFYCQQGEGKTQGQYRQMVRFNQCNLNCTFCDTRYSWGKGDQQVQLPEKLYSHLVISGGEPTLPENWDYICNNILYRPEVKWIEIETNGTQTPFMSIMDIACVDLWNISPKQPKYMLSRTKCTPDILHYKSYLKDYIVKFVINPADQKNDLRFVRKIQTRYDIPNEKIWLMPLTIKDDKQSTEMNTEAVYDIAFKKGFNFSARLHVLVKGNKRGI
jgi:7-carboxy-7-deazaguanine synthase